jgi:nucleotide-binding universal stress UspA family protein
MKNILVLTDFSAAAATAAESALQVAARLGADLYLVHVYPVTPYLPPAGLVNWLQQRPEKKRRESTVKLNREVRRLEKRLRSLQLAGHSPAIRPITLEGELAKRVSGLSRRKKSTLILMGMSERSYGGLLFDGEVKGVLQQVACPVLAIPAGWPGPGIGHILFATDLAAADEAVIGALAALAARLKARLSLCHVFRPVLDPGFRRRTANLGLPRKN